MDLTVAQQVQLLYVGYFSRAADAAGLAYWEDQISTGAATLEDVATAFTGSFEYSEVYGGLTRAQLVTKIYENVLGRTFESDDDDQDSTDNPIDQEGWDYWVNGEGSTVTVDKLILAFINAALEGTNPLDQLTVENKMSAAVYFTDNAVDDEGNPLFVIDTDTLEDTGALTRDDATDAVSGVGFEGATLDASKDATDAAVDAANTPVTNPAGTTFAVAVEAAAGADSMRITGDQDVRIDLTENDNQVTGLDLDGDGLIEINGSENVDPTTLDDGIDFEIIDAYARNPLDQTDIENNFFGNIDFDGTGFAGDGENTDGNIVLGGLAADTILGGIGNDFLAGGGIAQNQTGMDDLEGGRNADFLFAAMSLLSETDGDSLTLDGGETFDDLDSNMDSDWLLVEAADDEEPLVIDLSAGNITGQTQTLETDRVSVLMDEIEHINASGNLYGFLDDIATTIGERAGEVHTVGEENYGIGTSAQMEVIGSADANIIITGYDDDEVDGGAGNDIIFGGDIMYAQNNPNFSTATNNGIDDLAGDAGDDHIVYELDGGIYDGGADSDTLWIESMVAGLSTVSELVSDGTIRIDLAGYNGTGGNDSGTQGQTNGPAGTVSNFESVVATGLGAIDYFAAGTNDPELLFNNQQNYDGVGNVDLDLRGEAGVNRLYADQGDDIIEGRNGNDQLSGNNGVDQFWFAIDGDGVKATEYAGDGVDVIHRQEDVDGDGIWDNSNGQYGDGTYINDFGDLSDLETSDSSLVLTVADLTTANNELTDITVFEIRSEIVVADADNIEFTLATAEMEAANTYAELLTAVQNAIADIPEVADTLTADLNAANQIVITDAQGRELLDDLPEARFIASGNNIDIQLAMTFGEAEVAQSQDRLIYGAYEDRLDTELVDDDAIKGSGITLGDTGYAEDLVIDFADDGTRIAESQRYEIDFTNLTTEDDVTITVNGVEFSLCVGKDIDGDLIDNEDSAQGTAQATIQDNFLIRLADFIDSFMDNDTAAGQVDADYTPGSNTLVLTQVDYDGEETVFMDVPVVEITNGSGGEPASASVSNTSAHELHILDFDGRNGALNSENVLFWGNQGYIDENGEAQNSRSILETAADAGGTLNGMDAMVINAGEDDIDEDSDYYMEFNQTITSSNLNDNFTVHGDDLLIGGAGDDIIMGMTGDDRIHASLGDDTLDGGKDFYWVREIGQTQGQIEVLNAFEAAERDGEGNVAEVVLIEDLENEDGPLTTRAGAEFSPYYEDTLLAQQDDINPGVAQFTIVLDNFTGSGSGIELDEGGAGSLFIDADADGDFESETEFTNFENIRTVSGTGLAVAGNGQGNDTLDVQELSDASDGVTYNLSGDAFVDDVAPAESIAIGAVVANTGAAYDVDPTDDGNTAPDPVDPEGTTYRQYELPDAATVVISVDGVENVLAGDGADTLIIDETEAAKNNLFDGDADGLDSSEADTVIYTNDFTGGTALSAEPTVTFVVESQSDTDEIFMDEGRVGTNTAVDTLIRTEFVDFEGNTAGSVRENDVLDVQSQTVGATVDFVNGEVRNANDEVLVSIGNMSEFEIVRADGDDTVIVSDAMTNSREDFTVNGGVAGAEEDIVFDSYLSFDSFDADLNRESVSDMRANNEDNNTIPEVLNAGQFTFDLSYEIVNSTDTDRVDYSNELGTIAAVLAVPATGDSTSDLELNILVDHDSDGSLDEDNDRIDLLLDVEEVVAADSAAGDSILDFTSSMRDLEITFQYNAPASAPLSEGEFVENTIRIAGGDGNTIDGVTSFVERWVEGGSNAIWNRIEGSDYAEIVKYEGSEDLTDETGLDHRYSSDELILRGGDNNVSYTALETSITATVNVAEFDDTNALTSGLITTTVTFQDGDSAALPDGGTHTITSYTSDNGIAAGSLKLEATQDQEDTVSFTSTSDKVFILGSSAGVLDVQIGTLDTLRLTGFELLRDNNTDDVYTFEDMSAGGLTLVDDEYPGTAPTGASDRDTSAVGNDAVGFGNAGAGEISLEAINDFYAFDFDVLDVTEATTSNLTLLGDDDNQDDDANGLNAVDTDNDYLGDADTDNDGLADNARYIDEDELILDNLDIVDEVEWFDIISFGADTALNGNTLDIDLTNNTISSGADSFGINSLTSGDLDTVDLSRMTTGATINLTGAGLEVIGTQGDDTITGSGVADTIVGGVGADTLSGGVQSEVRQIQLAGILDGASDETVTITFTDNLANSVVLTLNEAAAPADVDATDNDLDIIRGAGSDAVGAALETLVNANLVDINALAAWDADLLSASYDSGTDLLTFTFAAGTDVLATDTIVVADTDAVAGTFAASAESVVTDGGDGGSDAYVYYAASEGGDTITGVLSGDDTIEFEDEDTGDIGDLIDDSGNDAIAFVSATDGDAAAAEAADLATTEAVFMDDAETGTLQDEDLTDLADIAALLEANFTLASDAADEELLAVVESTETAGTYGVYLWVSSDADNTFDEGEITLIATVTADDVATTDFVIA